MLKHALAACFLAALLCPAPASAWGARGHSVVAQIASDNLSPEAKRHVTEILAADGKTSMVSVASWADNEKALKRLSTSPMHTVRMNLAGNFYDKAVDCPDGRCVVEAMNREIATLSDPASPMPDKILALKYLIHFVGDVHQPLHAIKYIGHQRVIYDGKETNLHHVWDEDIIRSRSLTYGKLSKYIESQDMRSPIDGGPELWATESRDIGLSIYAEVPPAPITAPPVYLPPNYADQNWPIVAERLHQAGLRLAATLNKIFATKGPV